TSLALLLAATAPERRRGRVRAWAAVGGISAALGPVAGGLLVQADWRWVFLVNLPVGAAAIAVGLRVLPHPPPRAAEPLPDLAGAALLTAAIGGLTGGLVEGPSWGWTSGGTIALLAGAAVSVSWFLWRCAHHDNPMFKRVSAFWVCSCTPLVSMPSKEKLLSSREWPLKRMDRCAPSP